MKKEKQKNIIENYITAFNNFDIDKMIENLSTNITFKNTENGIITLTTNSKEEFIDISKKSMDFFKNRKIEIIDFDYVDNIVIVYYKFIAILSQDLNDKFKKGDTFNLGGKTIFTFKNKKIIALEDFS